MKRVIGLIACFSVVVFAQEYQYQQPQPVYYPPQQQQQQPPPQQYYAPAQGQPAPAQPQYYAPAQGQPVPAQPQYYAPAQPQYYAPAPQQYQQQYPQQYPQQQAQPYAPQPTPPPQQDAIRTQFGINALFVMGSTSWDDYFDYLEEEGWEQGLGLGWGGGFVLRIPINDMVSFVPEVNFLYRKLYNFTISDGDLEGERYMWECALSFPLMVQVTPIANGPLYISAGLQIDIPFGTTESQEVKIDGEEWSDYTWDEEFEDRTTDYGLAIGVGVRAGQSLAIEFRSVIGMTGLTDKKGSEDATFNQYAIVVSAFF